MKCVIYTFRDVLLKCIIYCRAKKLKQRARCHMLASLCQRLRLITAVTIPLALGMLGQLQATAKYAACHLRLECFLSLSKLKVYLNLLISVLEKML